MYIIYSSYFKVLSEGGSGMDLLKIGAFIATKRKEKKLTQLQLAELLHVTDRAVSKWECGRSMPDSSIMLELCEALGISVNELLTGEELNMENYNRQAELNLIEITKQKEESDKRLLHSEIVIGVMGTAIFFALIITAILAHTYANLPLWAMIVMFVTAALIFFGACFFAVRIEQKAGYYECKECGYKYVPSYKAALFAPHMGRSRKMVCPHCGKKSYHKKVINK